MQNKTLTSGRNNFPMYFSFREPLSALDYEEMGHLMIAVLDYAEYGVEPSNLSKTELLVFYGMRHALDRDAERYQHKVETGRANGHKGGRPRKDAKKAAQVMPTTQESKNAVVQIASKAQSASCESDVLSGQAVPCAKSNPMSAQSAPSESSAQEVQPAPQDTLNKAPTTEGDFLASEKPNPFLETPTATTTSTATSTATASATTASASTASSTATAAASTTIAPLPPTSALPVGIAAAGETPEGEGAAAAAPLLFWKTNMGQMPPYVADCLGEYRQKGCADDLVLYALERMVEAGSKNFLYARKILDDACGARLFTREAFAATKRGGHSGRNILPTRDMVGASNNLLSERNALLAAASRPRRLKRKEETS